MRNYLLGLALATLALLAACDVDPTTPVDATSPVLVTNLTVIASGDNSLTLQWTAPGDDGGSGTAESYQIRRSASVINGPNFNSATAVANPPAPLAGGTVQQFTVTGLDTTLVTHFALRATDEAGNTSQVSNDAEWIPSGSPSHLVKDIPPFKDNSLYAEQDSLSNGAGAFLFAGRTAGLNPPAVNRRVLLAFAIADSIPTGAVIDSVTLTLNVSKRPANTAYTFSLHLLTADWGEGTSDAGFMGGAGAPATSNDATWGYRFYNTTPWTTAGGDFSATPSAQTPVGILGFFDWSSTSMRADVQEWLDNPANNFGWILIGDEATIRSAKRFDSRENPVVANRPRLRVYYTVTP